MGGSPWRLLGCPRRRGRSCGGCARPASGLRGHRTTTVAVANLLVERGFVHPVPVPRPGRRRRGRRPGVRPPDRLGACLASLAAARGHGVVVVDDASPDAAAMAGPRPRTERA
jgi:hypothetical protein